MNNQVVKINTRVSPQQNSQNANSRRNTHHSLRTPGPSAGGSRHHSLQPSGLSADIASLIEARNLAILKFLNEMKFAVEPQIEERFFSFAKEKSKKYFESAKAKLLKLEYITTKTRENGKLPLLMITGKGHEYLCQKAEGKLVPDQKSKYFEAGIKHDLILNDLRHALEKRSLIAKHPSRNFKFCSQLKPTSRAG